MKITTTTDRWTSDNERDVKLTSGSDTVLIVQKRRRVGRPGSRRYSVSPSYVIVRRRGHVVASLNADDMKGLDCADVKRQMVQLLRTFG